MNKKIWLAIIAATLLLFGVINAPSPIRIEGDGVFYYAWLHSAWFDHDIDFHNQLEQFAAYDFFSRQFLADNKITAVGLTPNAYAFGAALMWLPFFFLAHLSSLIFQNFNPSFFAPDGYSYLYVWLINFSGWVYGWLALWLVGRSLRLIFGSERSKLVGATLAGLWLATPWLYYHFFEPFMSHLPALFLSALWLYCLAREYRGQKNQSWLLGLTAFLLLATRWQNIIFLLAYLPLLWSLRRQPRQLLKKVWPMILALAVFVGCQSLIWRELYGLYFLVPQGQRFVRPEFHGLYTLFSSDRGLLLWSPLLILALAGWPWLWHRLRLWAGLAALIFLLQWIANSSLNDLGGGAAFGARRFIETLPWLALPLYSFFSRWKKDRLIWLVIGLFIIWNLLLIQFYRWGDVPRSGEFDFFSRLLTSVK